MGFQRGLEVFRKYVGDTMTYHISHRDGGGSVGGEEREFELFIVGIEVCNLGSFSRVYHHAIHDGAVKRNRTLHCSVRNERGCWHVEEIKSVSGERRKRGRNGREKEREKKREERNKREREIEGFHTTEQSWGNLGDHVACCDVEGALQLVGVRKREKRVSLASKR